MLELDEGAGFEGTWDSIDTSWYGQYHCHGKFEIELR
jgi:hypothetical protein